MNNFMKRAIEALEKDPIDLYAMANYGCRRTGLPNKISIWCGPKGSANHEARIKVSNLRGKASFSNYENYFEVSISKTPEIVAGEPEGFSTKEKKELSVWVVSNLDILDAYWRREYTEGKFYRLLSERRQKLEEESAAGMPSANTPPLKKRKK